MLAWCPRLLKKERVASVGVAAPTLATLSIPLGGGCKPLACGELESPVGPWVARYGLTNGQFQQAFDQLTDQGYRLVNRSDWGVNGQALHAGIFEQRDGPPWCSYSNLTPKHFQQTFEDLTAKGYRLLRISGYGV